MDFSGKQLVIVSNRLPVAIFKDETDEWQVKASPGGLVTALDPIMKRNRGLWIGWPGCSSEAPAERLLAGHSEEQHYQLIPVKVTEKEIAKYYRGFSNRTIWPLFHDLLGYFSFDLDNWHIYHQVNQRFAEKTAASIDKDAFLWIHDYQLLFVGHYLRELGVKHQLNFFLHIPFPSVDLFRRLPWNRDVLQAILQYDHVGFQTPMDRRNFISCVKWLIPEAKRVVHKRQSVIRYNGREVLLGYYPISIDFTEFNDLAKSREVQDAAWYLRENLNTKTVVLGLDRLDYTKGIPERFLAFERVLEKYPETVGEISLLQIVIPSRLNVPDYADLKTHLDGLAGRINSRFSRQGWMPIHYQFRELERMQLVGHYQACDIALITPLRDGMNLVAKEYCASNVHNNGVLILSEFAGAAPQLSKGALVVNPFDLEGTADAIYAAYLMPKEERVRRMKQLRSEVKRHDVHHWVNWFLGNYRSVPSLEMSLTDTEPIEK
ncbi:trehalose-6-phosphate synthase [candidate division GN15 bacterium]|nr:trehalose-6-phosphate synthase [candidate division GN15 bacterium]